MLKFQAQKSRSRVGERLIANAMQSEYHLQHILTLEKYTT